MPTCEYCGRTFSKQSTMDIHMCEQKRRWQQKDNKVHVLAFEIFGGNMIVGCKIFYTLKFT